MLEGQAGRDLAAPLRDCFCKNVSLTLDGLWTVSRLIVTKMTHTWDSKSTPASTVLGPEDAQCPLQLALYWVLEMPC